MPESERVCVARVHGAHGLRGEIRASVSAGISADSLIGVSVWIVPPMDAVRESVVLGARRGPRGPLLALSGIADRSTAVMASGRELVARAADVTVELTAQPLDPVGLAVTDATRGFVGTVVDVIHTGANDVWVVEHGPYGEVLIPVIDDVVCHVDVAARVADVRLLDGLITED